MDVVYIIGDIGPLFCNQDNVGITGFNLADIGDRLGEDFILCCQSDHRNARLDQSDCAML